jgi:acyl-CoA thioesterase-2
LDGKHFSSRRVIAIQNGRQIFNMSASFQLAETGLEHQISIPDVPQPESLPDLQSYYLEVADRLPAPARRALEQNRPFEFRPVQAPDPLRREKSAGLKYVWFRAVDKLPDDEALHRCLLAYASDFHLLDTALKPHGESPISPKLLMASIDHAMWFHRSVRVDDWLLYAIDSPSASGARGFTRGSVFARDGQLVASAAQEGLIRVTS